MNSAPVKGLVDVATSSAARSAAECRSGADMTPPSVQSVAIVIIAVALD